MKKINFKSKFSKFTDRWSPKVIAEMNNYQFKLVKIKKGKIIATLKGSAKSILKAERVALNFIGLISGVATLTNKFIKKLK